MKKLAKLSGVILMIGTALATYSFMSDDTMSKENGVYVINTTNLGKDVKGFNGPTPIKLYIKNDKVERLEFLQNQETPQYYTRVKEVFVNKWSGKNAKDARNLQVDAVSGATYSSKAVIKNVHLALDYYQKNK